ncbi:serine dehydratase subunit alpha family protein [uncultured Cetobacterium sp.]|uniref:L-cysteine desulfidase family protein n=1 Tax=uncultured Cetobacterium sp. TaxID=527638 RepID=UPI00260E5DE7|nr:L-serine ammonia-lyase, iron-sulfur-dependent, subunit alpha [uncultured Cetobacterium sp.]
MMITDILNILNEEIVPAEGCTEPIALAYIGSKVTALLGGIPDKIEVSLSGNLIKNVKSVKIPNSEGMVGIEAAVAMGTVLGDSTKELMVISTIDKTKLEDVRKYLEDGRVTTRKIEGDTKLHIKATGTLKNDVVTIEIKDYHTNIVKIEKNGEVIKGVSCDEITTENAMTDKDFLTVELIHDLAKTIDFTLIEPIFKKVIEYNSAIAEEGLKNEYGVAMGKTLLEGMQEGVYGKDLKNKIISFTSAGSDARMNGCSMPVMTTSGSGNQGMTASLPVIKYCEEKNIPYEQMIRGLFFSHLTTIHIKSNVGRLSAYCGVVCAGGGVAGALSFLDGMPLDRIESAIETTLATLSGMLCDGAKSSCATKIASSIGMAFDSYYLSKKKKNFEYGEGIVGKNVESTLANIKVLAHEGLVKTDEVVLKIMLNN